MQTLRKKTSPLKYKNETTRFLGDGVSFKAKLIGILEVSEARGDRMCQEALSDLKMAIRAAGEHKQRITIHIALDGLRLRDEKTGDSLYHHPVHKISFIAQDMTDSRAFGYIFGSPDTGHRFFGIKTDKAASQVVIAMRDLFQVVFALKKKEIEIAKIHLEKTRFPTSPIFSETSGTSSKLQSLAQDKLTSDPKAGASASDAKSSGTAVADLVDLELELNSLQQGLNQMERITPSDPFGSKDDPFGDSFISYPKPILPPPPSSGRERSNRTSESSNLFSPKTPRTAHSTDTNASDVLANKKEFNFSQDFNSSHEEPSSGDWFTPSAGNSLFEEPSSLQDATKDEKHERAKQEILSQFDVFTELDPLGTGRSKPYIDKKHFFQELKNPPKKALNDLVQTTTCQSTQETANVFATSFNLQQQKANNNSNIFSSDPFGEDPFVKEDPFAEADFSKQDPFETELNNFDKFKFDSKKLDNLSSLLTKQMTQTSPHTVLASTSPRTVQFDTHFDRFDEKKNKLSHMHENPSLDISSESESAPEPPPRPAATFVHIKPPPLPPKKQKKPLPRLPTVESHYDYMDKYETAPNSLDFVKNIEKSPPLPVPARKSKFETDFTVPPERPKKQINVQSSEEDYLTPIKFKEGTEPVYQQPKKQPAEFNLSAEGLDMTLSQLTLSGLNELAVKLNIPSSQLSNMTLAQLTSYLSNFMKSNNLTSADAKVESNESGDGTFQADFAANFNNLNSETYDRYAVFRELMQEEIKQTKIDTEPEQLQEEIKQQQQENNVNLNLTQIDEQNNSATDKYAALREIVEIELKQNENSEDVVEPEQNSNDLENNENIINKENKFNMDEGESKEITTPKTSLIEYAAPLVEKIENQMISPLKSPKQSVIKSPIPNVVSEIIQTSTRLTSGSLSDVISGSSPEVDNTANSDNGKKAPDATAESWAIFDQANIPTEPIKEKPGIQSEEGVSPWSSDSKEFGNGSPPEWRGGNRPDHWSKRRREQEGWWDTSAEPETQYCPSNRRSTDSYDDEYYECYDRPRRRRQGNWSGGGQAAGGHSSSSRDVSPWEEEPCRRESRESRSAGSWGRHGRQQSYDRRRPTDSWDEEDDYEYDDEHGRFHWNERHSSRESERDRHSTGSREHEPDRWIDERLEDRRHRRRRDVSSRERWCCPDWDQGEHEKSSRYGRYGAEPPATGKWRERKPDARYYSRESQESPWEDEYQNEPEDAHSNYYLTAKSRNWKQRPSSASEMDRKTGEIKSRHYLGTGGSDSERDRRYKTQRRSRSRDSQYSEPPHRHKTEPTTSRVPHRTKMDVSKKMDNSKIELSNKKSSTLNRKKSKESPQEENMVSTFPRKSATSRVKSLFENDFVEPTAPIPAPVRTTKFQFDNDFETSETESPTTNVNRSITKPVKHQSLFEKDRFGDLKLSTRYQAKKSLFEDDFSPSNEKQSETIPEDSISSIKEEKSAIEEEEEEDSFSTNASTKTATTTNQPRRKILTKNRNIVRTDINLKKSESVNIFARESDPFDDDFFSGNDNVLSERRISSRNTELRWTEDFEDFDTENKK